MVPAGSDFGAALGAARLGRMAADELEVAEIKVIMQKPAMTEQIDPNKSLTDAYARTIARWRDLYRAVKC